MDLSGLPEHRARLAAVYAQDADRTSVASMKAMTAENWTTIRAELIAEIDGESGPKGAEILLLK